MLHTERTFSNHPHTANTTHRMKRIHCRRHCCLLTTECGLRNNYPTFFFLSSSACFSALRTMFSISSLLRPPDDWITTNDDTTQQLHAASTHTCLHWINNRGNMLLSTVLKCTVTCNTKHYAIKPLYFGGLQTLFVYKVQPQYHTAWMADKTDAKALTAFPLVNWRPPGCPHTMWIKTWNSITFLNEATDV